MARINYTGIVDSITGGLNGSVFQKNKSGYILRSKGHTKKAISTKQQISHSMLTWWVNEWNLCSLQEKSLWSTFAGLHPRINAYGRSMFLNGTNYFVSINRNRQLCGVGETLSPPIYTLPEALPTFTSLFTDALLSISLTSAVGDTSQFLYIQSTPVLSNVNTSFRRFLRYQEIIQLYGVDDINLLPNWELTHDQLLSELILPVNCCVGFRFQMFNRSTGLTGPVLDFIIIKS